MPWKNLAAAAAVLLTLGFGPAPAAEPGPLAEYLARSDASYAWREQRRGTIGETRYTELRLTSQTWRGIDWRHQLFVLRPPEVPAGNDHAFLFIAGGSWRSELEDPAHAPPLPDEAEVFARLAERMRTPLAALMQVPFQPILDGLKEDRLIAHTFDRFLDGGDADWPLLLPMTKSAVRAMDAVQAYTGRAWAMQIRGFTVSGASKRGWTTWLTAAVDPRVEALAPMVIDMLDMDAQLEHQIEAWGRLSYKIEPYRAIDLEARLPTPRGRSLQKIVDPYSYRERLTQPKLVILGTNDRYWPIDALNLYWDDLRPPRHVMYVPNNRHSLKDIPRLVGSLTALNDHAARGRPLPELDWSFRRSDRSLRVQLRSDVTPSRVVAWVARSESRDFREAHWQSYAARRDERGWRYELPAPRHHFAALYLEAVYDAATGPYYLTTTVRILPPRQQR